MITTTSDNDKCHNNNNIIAENWNADLQKGTTQVPIVFPK